jgi:uncharacterized protein (DUF2345 family)
VESKRATLADLPLAAQAVVGATLGREDQRYHALREEGGVRLENAAHGFTARLRSAGGLEVERGKSRWGLELRGIGYGEELAVVGGVEQVRVEGNRVEYERGGVQEWYVNGPLGLEQGFTLARAPMAEGQRSKGGAERGPLTVALRMSGGWQAQVEVGGRGAVLRGGEREELGYRGLVAQDAQGRELRAWMEVRGEELLLRVDDAGARYPIVVDPFVQQAKLTASDGAPVDQFGISVAVSGDTVVVGAPSASGGGFDPGAAYVFVKPIGGWNGNLTQTAKLTASDGLAFDRFGRSVAISGHTVVVGAFGADIGSNTNQGAAYVFVKPSGGWSGNLTENAKLTASDGAAFDEFGTSVAVSGDTVVVGARGNNSFQGAAYVFVKPGGGWSGNLTQDAKLTASDGAASDVFGSSVAVSGDTVVVGAPHKNSSQGAAYVFVKPSGGWSGNLTQDAKLTASDGAAGDEFGVSVAISGDTVVVGAPFDDIGGNTYQGAAYVFVKPSGGWTTTSTFTAKLTASDGAVDDYFGSSVAVSGDTVVVGAPVFAEAARPGAAYVFGSVAPPRAPLAAPVASPSGLMAAVGVLLTLGLRRLRRGREAIRGF